MASNFSDFFEAAADHKPFDYQRRLAGDESPDLKDAILDGPKSLAINMPTGAGKTVAVRTQVPRSAVEAGGSVRGRCGRR